MNGRSLIVGASGQVGNQIGMILGETALRSGRSNKTMAMQSRDWVHVDLIELATTPAKAQNIIDSHELSAVYCVAGATDVERCESYPDWAMESNCYGPLALAKAATSIPFIYFSTEYIFNGEAGPYEEGSPTEPISVYGRSKLQGEQEILRVHPNALIIRTTVVFGHDPVQKNFLYTLRRLIGSGKPMRIPSDQISTPTYNCDLASATVALVNSGHTGIFHVCGPELLSRHEFALIAAKKLGLDTSLLSAVPTSELNQRAPRPLSAGLKIAKLQRTLPNFSMRNTEDALTDWIAQEGI